MHESMKQMIQTFAKQRVLRRRAYAAFTALALVVSISTMYTLSKPAVTMTGTPMCGLEEHVHDEDCYIEVLVCGVENHNAVDETAEAEPAHEHDETCYEQQPVQICTLEEGEAHAHSEDCNGIACGEEEYEAHTHDETCYTTRDQQICGEDEYDAHTHDESCFETHAEQTCGESEYEAHSHDDSCYTTFTDTICGESEYEAHSHDDGCYTTFNDKICGESEYDAHSHDDGCYTEVSKLTCGDDSEEHSHDDGCYTTETKLSCSAKEGPGHTHDESCYNEHTELTCTAKEGPGHAHSESCFQDRTELTCSAKEGPGHAHSDACYTDVTTQTCTAKEGPGHAHSEACYTEVTELTCTAKEGPGHTHSEACEGIVCGKEESEGHVHGETCFELQDVLVCTAGQETEADDAGHTEDCYERVLICKRDVHTHNSTCYQPIEELAPICGLEEHVHTGYCYQMELICTVDHSAAAEDAHQHGEECYEQQSVLTCTLAEAEPHTHEEACYGIACGREESEGHVHGDDCYTVTTEQTCGQEEGEAHTHDETCVTETRTLICETEESEGHAHDESCIGLVCGKEETEGHVHGETCFELQDVLTCTIETEVPTGHTDECFEKTLICEIEEHIHTEACYPVQMMMVLPEGAEIPEGYDDVRTFTSEDGTFGVAVYAQPGAIPEDATLVAEILAEDSDEYAAAAESLDAMLAEEAAAEETEDGSVDLGTETLVMNDPAEGEPTEEPAEEETAEEPAEEEITEEPVEEPVVEETEEVTEEEIVEEEAEKPYDGLIAMDIRFEDADGDEVEPYEPVYVVINALGLLPETADPASVSIQHHAEIQPVSTFSLRRLLAAPAEPEIVVTTVADATEDTGIVELAENAETATQDMLTAFPVESFSTFTLTWYNSNNYAVTIHYVDTNGNPLNGSLAQNAVVNVGNGGTWANLSTYSALDASIADQYEYQGARLDSYTGTVATEVQYYYSYNYGGGFYPGYPGGGQTQKQSGWYYRTADNNNDNAWAGDSAKHIYLVYSPVGEPIPVTIADLSGTPIEGAPTTMNIPTTGEWIAINTRAPAVTGYVYTEGHLNSAQGNRVSYVRYVASADGKSGTWYVSNTTSGEGTILDSTKSVWLLYDTATIPVTIHLVDENGNEVGADVTKSITKNAETEISTLVNNTVEGRTYYQARVNSADGKLIKSINYNNTTKQWSYTTPSGAVTTMNPGVTPEVYAIYVGETFQGITPPGITVNVFNYTSDGNNGINANHALKFTGAGADDSNTTGFNAWTGSDADVYQGIVERTLPTTVVNGKTVYGNPVLQSDGTSLDYLFNTTSTSAKAVYDSADCLFQQNDEGYYYYDSDQNFAKLNTNTKEFDLYYRDSDAKNGNDPVKFAPFDNIDEYTNDGYHMGMTVEGTFIMPKAGQVNSKDMVFDFTGDDDVWVFIDGILILDLGGIHLASSGSINFATGEVEVNKVAPESTDSSGTNTTIRDQVIRALGQTEGQKWVNDNMVQVNGNWVFKDYSEHTLSFFYLERGAGGSNCKIKFNLPTIPKNSLVVGKELEAGENVSSELVDFVAGELDYTFEVLKVVDGEVTETSMFDLSNTSKLPTFQIMQDGQQIGTGTVKADGTFTLKAGQSAVFDGLLVATAGQYVVRETMPSNMSGQYLGAQYDVVSGGGTTSEDTKEEVVEGQFTQYTTDPLSASNTTSTVMYRNIINMQALSMLRVTKVVRPGSDIADDAEFSIKILIDGEDLAVGTPYKIMDAAGTELRTGTTSADGIIKIKRDETVALASGILQGSVITVYEVNDGGYTIAYEGTITGGGTTADMTVGTGGITGTVVNTNSVAHVTVYNSDYSFAASVPISKTLLGADAGEKKAFTFTMYQLDAQMQPTGKPYNTVINTTGSATKTDTIYFGFGADAATGDYYYRINEVIPDNKGGISYDESSYVVKITVTETGGIKSAAITGITKYTDQAATAGAKDMGTSATLAFENSKSGALSLTKIAKKDGVDLAGYYTFQIEIPTANGTYSVYDGQNLIGTVTFTNGSITAATGGILASGDSDNSTIAVSNNQTITIKGLPANQKAVIRETRTDGFAVSWSGDLADAASANGPSTQTVEITGAATVAVTCTNTTGAALPNTGGIGTSIYTLLGSMMMLSAGVLLMIHRRRREAT